MPDPTRFSRKPIPTDDEAARGFRRLGLDLALDGDRSLQREPLVELLRSGVARVTDDGEATLRRRDFARDQAQPHVVRAADFRVRQELERAGTEQELDREAVGREAEGDDFRERFFGVVGTPELGVRKIEAVEDAQLLSFGTRRRRLVVAQRLRIVARFVAVGAFADQGVDRQPRHVDFVRRARRSASAPS